LTGFLRIGDGPRVPVEHGLTIGRVAGCDLVIQDTKASRRHARVVVEGGVVEIEDLGSSNGTLLNGKPVQRRMLRHGDVVQIGTTLLTFEEESAEATSGVPAVDDVDLFGGDEVAPAPATAVPSAPEPPPRAAEPPPPAAEPPPRRDVLEFEDEVVQVRKPAPTAPKATSGEPVVERTQRVLQYSKHATGGGLMRDDLAQMSPLQRNLLILLAVAAAVGLGYLAMELVSG